MKTLSVKEFFIVWFLVVVVSFALEARAQAVVIDAQTGRVIGNLNANKYDGTSIANPYSELSNPYSANSLNNPYGTTANPYSAGSMNNPYSMPAPTYRYNYRNY